MSYYVGVDVGTGSARASVLDAHGRLLGEATHETTTWRSEHNAHIFEQSAANIWACVGASVRDAVRAAGVPPAAVAGIGFDATCSLVVQRPDGTPQSVTPHGDWRPGPRNVILWADHRAEREAADINATGHMVLDYVGKTMSLEMEIPKVLWLKRHMPADLFPQCEFFDLPDWLTFQATGDRARSNCSLVCKCSYVPPGVAGSELGWQPSFFEQIGLGDLVQNGFAQLGGIPGRGGVVLTAGQPVGQGLSPQAAQDLGLSPGTPVGSGVIDAYAGWVGTVAAGATNARNGQEENENGDVHLAGSGHRLAAIAGTSTCYCVQSPEGILVPGVWGPYKNAIFPGFWMNEGGQSSTGQLIDFVLTTHPAYAAVKAAADGAGQNLFVYLDQYLHQLQAQVGATSLSHLTKDLLIYPDFHGNRSPLADTQMRGMVVGQRLDSGSKDLALKYFATLEGIALQMRHILQDMNGAGHDIREIYMSGGQCKNRTFMQLIADVCRVPVQLPPSPSAAVVGGSAILGKFAADQANPPLGGPIQQPVKITSQDQADQAALQHREHLWSLMRSMTPPGQFLYPQPNEQALKLLDAKYAIFLDMVVTQRKWRADIEAAA